MMRLLVLLAAICCAAFPSWAQTYNKNSLNGQVAAQFPDQNTGSITPATTRGFLLNTINSFQQAPTVNAQVGATYALSVNDYGLLVTFNNSGAVAVTLPQATGSFSIWNAYVKNLGSGTVTITPTTSTINGAATFTVTNGQAIQIVSDGVNYQVINGSAPPGGSSGQVQTNNGSGGFAGITNAQLTALINPATASLPGALPAWPNTTSTFFRGDGSYQTLNCAALASVAASCGTDATNASNISSGTLGAARLPAFVGDSGSGGTQGAVPAPTAGQGANHSVLRADGTFNITGLTNVALVKSAAYTLAPADAGKTVQLGGSAFYGLTIPAVGAFAADYIVKIDNVDNVCPTGGAATCRGKLLLQQSGTSATSTTIATGAKTFTTQSGLGYGAGSRIRVWSLASTANYMSGTVTSYSTTSLVVNVDTVGGSGTLTDWQIGSETTLYPGQSVLFGNDSGAWASQAPVPWEWNATNVFYACSASGVQTFASGGTSGAGMVASDANDGLSINAPFATIQRALNTIRNDVHLNGFGPVVQRCNAATTEQVNAFAGMSGFHFIQINGDTTTPSNAIWACGANNKCIHARDGGILVVSGFKFCSGLSAGACDGVTTGAAAFAADGLGALDIQNVEFNAFPSGHAIECSNNANINLTGSAVSITASMATVFYITSPCTVAVTSTQTWTISGSLTWTSAFLEMYGSGGSFYNNTTWTMAGAGAGSGTAGQKFNIAPGNEVFLGSVVLPGANPGLYICQPTSTTVTAAVTDATFSTPTCTVLGTSFVPKWLELTLVGGGGGGAGSGTTPGAAAAGGATCWNTSGTACSSPVFSAGGGGAGAASGSTPAAGGTVTGSGTCNIDAVPGAAGALGSTLSTMVGGIGGGTTAGQGGAGGASSAAGAASAGGVPAANSGGGGGGAGDSGTAQSGGGGGGGATCSVIITNPAASYKYTLAAAAAGGTLGTSGSAGGNGAVGKIIIKSYWAQ